MFGKLARFVVHNPWKIIAAWIIAAVAVVALAPTLTDVLNKEQSGFLPDTYESIQAQHLAEEQFGKSEDATATIVIKREDGQPLSAEDQAKVEGLAGSINATDIDRVVVAETGPQALAENKEVQLVSVGLQGMPDEKPVGEAVKEIRKIGGETLADSGLRMSVTGDAALMVDNEEAFKNAEAIIGIVTVLLIIGLLLVIYRSPVAALLPIVSVGIVSSIAPGIIALVAKGTGLQVDQSLQIILTVVLFGVGTDYILFLLFRFRERLRAGEEKTTALIHAVERVGEVIASAAGAIIVAFCALLLAIFGAFRSLGPGLAIGVGIMALASLTLIPAIVSLIGTKVFWPSKSWQKEPKGTVFAKLGAFTGRRPGVVALVSGGLLVVMALGMFGFKTDYDQLGQLPSTTESARGIKDLQSGFPAGALNPTLVYLHSTDGSPLDPAEVERVAKELTTSTGIGGAMPANEQGDLGLISKDGSTAQINLLLEYSPQSNEALDAVDPLREAAHAAAPEGTEVLVGGPTAAFTDIRDANNRDLSVIFPVAGVLIALILGLLLRSLVAPLYLMASVVLVFFSTMGATAFLFSVVGDRPGISFSLPIMLYLFVVAIGTDYNILMIARLREEAREGRSPREAARLAIEHGGPSVGAAGIILAGTFGSMMLSGIAMMTEMGFAVALGILLSSFVMSMFLVPSITALLGHKAWWPGHGDAVTEHGRPEENLEPARV
ncbi:RND superfamily putative drug exporter [Rhodococcus sp. OK611]|uniref:MMPL family transporter n=1 Tax=unclassified Rhodococcus (in: high G+C Gram-positive bacteria) TaxID=192944 RepID=UPI000BC867A2|nr:MULTISPECIES: MMPL family transporter [unclassified Rhodococcus (in: high G+C Gram-positive bacteria)]PTR39547.1 RND superfamily putative drug exporter [Rhodococcus sp. OK611]SNX92698.1 putative drug exporter of the RND superfamily [Rhodococcus sp. OK270]